MEMEYVSEFPHNYMDRRPRKRPRLAAAAWDIPPQPQPHTHTKVWYSIVIITIIILDNYMWELFIYKKKNRFW